MSDYPNSFFSIVSETGQPIHFNAKKIVAVVGEGEDCTVYLETVGSVHLPGVNAREVLELVAITVFDEDRSQQ